MKTYAAIVRDHSGSMRPIVRGALADYNLTLDGLKDAEDGIQQIELTVVECGVGYRAAVNVAEVCRPVKQIRNMTDYVANGNATPLWDSVGEAITQLEKRSQYPYITHDNTTAFLVMVITDGQENSSKFWSARTIAAKIRELQATDKWTFVFRVPRGDKASLVKLGIPEGNIMEWEQTERGYAAATTQHTASTQAYFKSRSAGKTATNAFYVDANLNSTEVKVNLVDATNDFYKAIVTTSQDGIMIRDFCERVFGVIYKPGYALYQLTKREEIQDYKKFAVREKSTGRFYTGPAARQVLGLPTYGTIKVIPSSNGAYEIFVQSNSVNRKLVAGTTVLYTIR